MNADFQLNVMQNFFRSGATRPAAFRAKQLGRLAQAVEANMEGIHRALRADLRKCEAEAFLSETGYVLRDIRSAQRNLRRWMRPAARRMPAGLQPARAQVVCEPKGVVLIIGPWNYPFQLMLSPLTAALAAGNCAVLKPSECTPHTSSVLKRLISDTFDPEYVCIVEGGRETAEALLEQPFDHIFLTGSGDAGRGVMAAAAQRLIPVTLELGGKSPAIVCAGANLPVAARRIARGKFMNAGQTCVAPDHVWVAREQMPVFCDELKRALAVFYGNNPQQSPDYGRIVSRRQFDRIRALMQAGETIHGGETDADDLYIAPTLIRNPPPGSLLMTEEIFGPVLPLLEFDSEQQIIAWCRAQPVPLALYLFTNNRVCQRRLLEAIPSGGVCINDTVSQIIPSNLPFGGRGASGMGRYHGKAGFDEFSHVRSVLRRSTHYDLRAAYPPVRASLKTLKRLYRFFAGS